MRTSGAVIAIASVLFAASLPVADALAQNQKKKKKPAARPPAVVSKPAPKPAPKIVAIAKPEWRFLRQAGAPTLGYGSNAAEFQLSLSCQPEAGLLRVIAQIGSRGLQPGDGAAIRLANGKNRFEIAGTAFSTVSRKDVDVGGATRYDPELFLLFEGGETLVVEVPGRRRSLPITEAGPSADAFQKACTATAAAGRSPAG